MSKRPLKYIHREEEIVEVTRRGSARKASLETGAINEKSGAASTTHEE
jgi:hypothetical protein